MHNNALVRNGLTNRMELPGETGLRKQVTAVTIIDEREMVADEKEKVEPIGLADENDVSKGSAQDE